MMVWNLSIGNQVLPNGNKRKVITYGRKYNGLHKRDGFLGITMDIGNNNIGPLSFYQAKFNEQILKNNTLVWNVMANPTTIPTHYEETVGRQFIASNVILQRYDDLSTNNYDNIMSDKVL